MHSVMIKCPQTGDMVPTGLVMDEEVFRQGVAESYLKPCPSCGQGHAWGMAEAWLRVPKRD